MKPTIGRIVHYTLSDRDATDINHRRDDFNAFRLRVFGSGIIGVSPGYPGASGHVAHVGNRAAEGDVFPAMVVCTFESGSTSANLQVHLDGNDTYWATSRMEGDGPGCWSWPPRVEHEPGDRPARY